MNNLTPYAIARWVPWLAAVLVAAEASAVSNHPVEANPLPPRDASLVTPSAAPSVPVLRRAGESEDAPLVGDLDAIRQLGRLRVLVPERHDVRFGDQREDNLGALLDALSQRLGLPVERVEARSRQELLSRLVNGRGDIIVGLAPSEMADDLPAGVSSSFPIARGRFQVLTARSSALARQSGLDAAFGRTLTLRPDSPLWSRVEALTRAHPWVRFVASPLHLDDIGVAAEVASGRRDALVLPSHEAERLVATRDDLVVAFDLGESATRSWYVRDDSPTLLAELNAFLEESQIAFRQAERYRGDLPVLRQRGVLRAIVRPRPGAFAIVDGSPKGFDYQVLSRFARDLGLTLETQVARTDAEALRWLDEGRGDLVAAAVELPPQGRFERSLPYWYSAPVVVAPVWVYVKTAEDLTGRRCLLPPDSPVLPAIEALLAREEVDFELDVREEYRDEAVLRDALIGGAGSFTVMPSASQRHLLASTPELVATLSLHDPASHRWVTRSADMELAAALNRTVRGFWGSRDQAVLSQQYLAEQRRATVAHGERRLSPYDDLARATAATHGFDWRLIVAIMYQESGFDPQARSPVGALGLMQVLPSTAATVGVHDLLNPASAILAGVRYLNQLRGQFDAGVPVKDRTWFAVASYHAGASRVEQARNRAQAAGLDADRWFGHVEKAMEQLAQESDSSSKRGVFLRTIDYVRDVRTRFDTYVQVTAPTVASAGARATVGGDG
jgi:membrane-bound lytic murein transglycosylase F